ncbi:cellulose synthase subunit BcsC-related outer membrane protein [Acidithiobacillus ferrivorans]|uniref:BCSC C-terminal domain-containing protein n=1 Tax=Acidithiobacillus ferrivorans TaxID=160808 RepID=A0A7T5BFN3_9PROT|nr:cellulose synthase subunit BcsC-related outer membrane protein [Acidithiobacillus ferrivorans]QQD71424.1 BCSC C-terminal domain-containing protein [Acidithiobacillus ferrivorans]
MPDLRRSILIAVSMVALAPAGAPAAMADNASGALDVRMKAELSRLQSEQHHLEGQLAMAHEIAKLQSHINQMRQELLQSLQHSNGYSRHLSSRTPNPSLSRTTEPVPPVYAQVQPQPEAMANRTTNEPLSPINAEAPRSSSGETEIQSGHVADARAHIEQQIEKLRAQLSTWVGGGVGSRARTGTTGLSRLNETNVNAAASTTLGNLGRLTVSASNVHLSAGGQPDAADAHLVGSAPAFGFVPNVTDRATGTGFSLLFARPDLQMDIGSTPTGFLEHGLTGGIAWQPGGGPLSLQADRRPVVDSLLSYAGMYDPYTGSNWGGVFANTVQIAAGAGQDPARYGSLSYAVLQGSHVAANHRWSVDGGLRWPVATGIPDEQVHVGINMLFMSYAKNLSFFTLGQGGYFSPQTFYRPSATVDWEGYMGAHAVWKLSGRLGWQTFQQSSSPYFPMDPALQAQASAVNHQYPYYPAQNVSSIAYAVTGQLAYLFAPQWLGTGWLRMDNSRNYQDTVAGVSLQYYFSPLSTPPAPDSLIKPWMTPQ